MDGDDLRRRLATGEPVLMPGVWDALSAKLAAEAGFDTVFLSGYCVSGTQLGLPDFGYLTQGEMAEVARRVCRAAPRRWWWSTATPATATRSTPSAPSSCGSRPGRPASSSRTRSGPSGAATWRASRSCPRDEWLAKLPRRRATTATGCSSRRAPTPGPRSASTRPSSGPAWRATSASTPSSSRRRSRIAELEADRARPCPASPWWPTWSRRARRRCSRRASWPTSASTLIVSPLTALFAATKALPRLVRHPAPRGHAARPPRPAGRLRRLHPRRRPRRPRCARRALPRLTLPHCCARRH